MQVQVEFSRGAVFTHIYARACSRSRAPVLIGKNNPTTQYDEGTVVISLDPRSTSRKVSEAPPPLPSSLPTAMASNCRQRAGNFLSRERLLKQSSEQLEPSLTYQRPRYGMPIVYTNINCVHRSAPSLLSLSGYYADWRSVGMLMTRDAVVTPQSRE